MQKGQTLVLILIGILVIALVAGGAYFLGKSQSSGEISDAKLQEMISNCEIIGTYRYHSGEHGVVFKEKKESTFDHKTLEIKNKTSEELVSLVKNIPQKCGDTRLSIIE